MMNEENKNVDETGVALVQELENLDKQSEEKKKQLKRKVTTRNITILGLIIVIIILLLRGCGSDGVAINFLKNPSTETTDYKDKDVTAVDKEHVDVYVVMDAVVNAGEPYLLLANPATNEGKFYLQFELYANGDDTYFYQSDMVEATNGEDFVLPVDVYSMLDAGEYKIKVVTKAYFYDSLQRTNGGSQTINVVVQK